MFRVFILILALIPLLGSAQNPKGFDEMCKGYIEETIPLVSSEQLSQDINDKNGVVVLDAREETEFRVSHIKGALNVGYDRLNLRVVKRLPKDAKIVIYCSIGYRSEKVGEKLKKAGYTNVYNLYGGIFDWSNNGYPLENMGGSPTRKVHGYDQEWGKWINPKRSDKILK